MTDKKQMVADRSVDSFVRQMRQLLLSSLAALTWLTVFSPPQTSAVTGPGQSPESAPFATSGRARLA